MVSSSSQIQCAWIQWKLTILLVRNFKFLTRTRIVDGIFEYKFSIHSKITKVLFSGNIFSTNFQQNTLPFLWLVKTALKLGRYFSFIQTGEIVEEEEWRVNTQRAFFIYYCRRPEALFNFVACSLTAFFLEETWENLQKFLHHEKVMGKGFHNKKFNEIAYIIISSEPESKRKRKFTNVVYAWWWYWPGMFMWTVDGIWSDCLA